MMSSPHLFPHNMVYKILKFSNFLLKHVTKYIRTNIILYLFSVDVRQFLLSHSWSMGFFVSLWTKLMENCEAITSLTHLLAYSYRLFKKGFMKIPKIRNFITKKKKKKNQIYIIYSLFYMIYICPFIMRLIKSWTGFLLAIKALCIPILYIYSVIELFSKLSRPIHLGISLRMSVLSNLSYTLWCETRSWAYLI